MNRINDCEQITRIFKCKKLLYVKFYGNPMCKKSNYINTIKQLKRQIKNVDIIDNKYNSELPSYEYNIYKENENPLLYYDYNDNPISEKPKNKYKEKEKEDNYIDKSTAEDYINDLFQNYYNYHEKLQHTDTIHSSPPPPPPISQPVKQSPPISQQPPISQPIQPIQQPYYPQIYPNYPLIPPPQILYYNLPDSNQNQNQNQQLINTDKDNNQNEKIVSKNATCQTDYDPTPSVLNEKNIELTNYRMKLDSYSKRINDLMNDNKNKNEIISSYEIQLKEMDEKIYNMKNEIDKKNEKIENGNSIV